jgi:uncharacterized membrane protein
LAVFFGNFNYSKMGYVLGELLIPAGSQRAGQHGKTDYGTNQALAPGGGPGKGRLPAFCPGLRSALGILSCIFVWVLQSEVLQQIGLQGYNQPFATIWFSHTCYILCLPLWLLLNRSRAGGGGRGDAPLRLLPFLRGCVLPALGIAVITMGANYSWFASLTATTVPVNNTISQSTFVFVFAMSVLFLGQPCSAHKVLAVLLAAGGVAVFALAPLTWCGGGGAHATNASAPAPTPPHGRADWLTHDAHGATHVQQGVTQTWWGLALCVLATFLQASYECFCQVCAARFRTRSDLLLLLGAVGLCNALFLWVGFLVFPEVTALTASGIFLRDTLGVLPWLLLNAALDLTFNVLLIYVIALTSPLTFTVGMLLVVPSSFVGDGVLRLGACYKAPGPMRAPPSHHNHFRVAPLSA